MDIAKYLAFGDPFLSNGYYVVVEPMSLTVMLAGLAVAPWFGVWQSGVRGLVWAAGLAVLAVLAKFLWFHQAVAHFDDDSKDAFMTLARNLSLIEIAVLAASSLAARWRLNIRRRE